MRYTDVHKQSLDIRTVSRQVLLRVSNHSEEVKAHDDDKGETMQDSMLVETATGKGLVRRTGTGLVRRDGLKDDIKVKVCLS